jgi:hypothetical protein
MQHLARYQQPYGFLGGGGELLHVDMCSLQEWHCLPGQKPDGQRPSLITKGKPASSRGCYQVVPTEHLVQARAASNIKCNGH